MLEVALLFSQKQHAAVQRAKELIALSESLYKEIIIIIKLTTKLREQM